ncbi:nucleolar protein 11 [Asbolus verrucosus]|uniref:Nucleolar protein 11 n=1 Tax=Asbolus verrucosus TaxID=1661398 RepID=A0A482VC55_ASBVE|nr:nucleolar protein 11 [Asbolus verrucosus]
MAKLGAYYGLCPLIDHRSLLGISEDEENGIVIVTLGKNIAIKYKLLDQKQLYSWRTKEKFSSPIIYDRQQSKYVAVFNESYLRMWNGKEEFLDKLKKFKFNQQINTIFSCNNRNFILFKNGAVYSLKEAIENRKELNPENVIDVNFGYINGLLYTSFNEDIYVGLIIKSKDKNCLHWTKFNASGSDGRIYSIGLKDSDLDSANIGELFTVVESVSCKEYVSLKSLDQNYIAMYGCNSNEEGALLVIYNVQFKVIQSKQPFKLFTNGAKLWCIDRNLLFPVGQNLAVIPFYLDMEQLAALVGSHKVIECDPDPDVSIVQKVQVVTWGNECESKNDNIPEVLRPKIANLLTQGLSGNTIFETLLPDLVESKNVEALSESIKSKLFKCGTQSSFKDFPPNLQPVERTALLDVILTKSFNETQVLPYLRSMLTLDEALTLLEYIYFLLTDDGHLLPLHSFAESEAKLIAWGCVLIDANYQKFLLTRDNRVNEVLSSLRNLIKEELGCFDDLRHVFSLMNEIKQGKAIHKTMHVVGLNYSVDEFPLY